MVKSTNYTQIAPVKGRPTIFGNVVEKNVSFLIDTSGSMYHSIEIVKEHLIDVLSSRASSGRDTMFNVITFDENVTKWANGMVRCTPRTVSMANEWIRRIRCGTSTNTMEALLQAYEDDGMDAIYLVTDGLPDQAPAVILHNVNLVHNGRPIHTTYITGTHTDQAAIDFLESIAKETKGSLHVISLTSLGHIQKVTPVYNEKTVSSVQNYISDSVFMPYSLHTPPGRPSSAPPMRSLVPDISNPLNYVSILKAPHGPVQIPYVSRYIYDKNRESSQVLDYADSVLASRGLAEFVNKSVSSVPVAASIMKGIKVLARRDSDGLYYMATVRGQIQNEKFILEFHKCPAIPKPFVQETPIYECIAVKDSIRHNVCIGDKVLAPWQPDGRYGPGTVIDGVDRRDLQSPGFEQGSNLLLTFYNGETTEVEPGIAIRIPLDVFNRLVTEQQLPESQRRRLRLAATTTTPEYSGHPPHPETTWQRKFTPVRTQKNSTEADDDSELKARIEEQLNRNKHLLDALSLKEKMEKLREKQNNSKEFETTKEVRFDDECDDDDSEVLDVEHAFEHETQTIDKYDIDTGTQTDFTKYVGRGIPIGTPLAKAGGRPEPKKRWRTWSSGVPPRPSRFRDTLLSKPAEAKQEKPVRPGHQEYQTTDGVAFPSATDKKFNYQRWHPHYGFTQTNGDPKLKHHEYRSNKGVPFPSATDRKFASVPSSNWSPDQAGRSACWEDGLGHGDTKRVMKEQARLDRKRHVAEQYENRIQKDAMEKDKKESSRQQNHRNKINQRNQQIADDAKQKERHEHNKLQYKKQSSQQIRELDAQRETKAATWKEDRINAMKTRRVQHEQMEQSYEKAADDFKREKHDGLKQREQKRYEAHHQRLVSERASEEAREQRLKGQEINRQNKLNKIKADAENSKEMRIHIKRQNQERYRASIMP